MNLRLQSSWLLEAVSEVGTVDSVFFPVIHRFSALNWLSRRDFALTVNAVTASQAMILRAWLDGQNGSFSASNLQKFNQQIRNPLDLSMNPFRAWKDRWFDRQQLDYLFYWREAAFEIEEETQREIFWSAVYQIMSCWLSNRAVEMQNLCQPDELMGLILNRHGEFIRGREAKISISNCSLDELAAKEACLTVFPLMFADEETPETTLQVIFSAWQSGHDDLEHARRELKVALRKYQISIERPNDYYTFTRLSANSQITAIVWSGADLPPTLYEQELVMPLQKAFAGRYSRSRLLMKAVDRSSDSFDYQLLLY
ncbi:MAG: hypothetical protein CVV41_19905 [Candidatus Riflebacteria bacterium HGW-Riflebacteria-1]|jgi:hypothetical protein|nr:MAG: hypothetical protein CVV41_19905 [Candidatus Riflebacteria bacterium HGW-Riflebacteria-1]